MEQNSILKKYCDLWGLDSPVKITSTLTSVIYRVSRKDGPAVLKILNKKGKKFEAKGAFVLKCFDGFGAARVFEQDAGAYLMEYIDGVLLKELVIQNEDEKATAIICEVIQKLHSYQGPVPTDAISMTRNFQSLFTHAQHEAKDSIYYIGAKLAEELISTPQRLKLLHGDLHHENILYSEERGWLAIDPQCLYGEDTYDLANTFFNPLGFLEVVNSPEVIQRRSYIFSETLNVDPQRILKFAFAYGALSACWKTEDGISAEDTLKITESIGQLLKVL